MAQFPSLIPSEAPIAPGAWPATAHTSLNGSESRIRHGSAEIGRAWRPSFVNITEADYLAILAHYRGQRSGFDSFGFGATTLAADLTPAGFAWLYASRPQVVDQHLDCFTVQCEFRCEPRGLVVVPGKTWRTGATVFTPGGRSSGIVYGAGAAWVTTQTTLKPQANPPFSQVSILLHCDGSNDSTVFADSSSNAITLTAAGNAKISTAQSRYGGASASFSGTNGDRVTASTASGGFNFESGNFTIQASARFSSVSTNQSIINVWSADSTGAWRLLITGGALYFEWKDSSGTSQTITSGPVLSVNTWYDFTVARSGNTISLYNGPSVPIASGNISGNIRSSSDVLAIGGQNDGAGTYVWVTNGNLEEIRVTKGAALTVTPNTAPFPDA